LISFERFERAGKLSGRRGAVRVFKVAVSWLVPVQAPALWLSLLRGFRLRRE
jgi:hypothetical protein